jgi:hypothetical protein
MFCEDQPESGSETKIQFLREMSSNADRRPDVEWCPGDALQPRVAFQAHTEFGCYH